jgi:hypothetical protein
LARGGAVHLARTIGGCGLTEIARVMDYRSYSGASSARRRFLLHLGQDPSLVLKLELAQRLLRQNET